jgi:hypothetical protein
MVPCVDRKMIKSVPLFVALFWLLPLFVFAQRWTGAFSNDWNEPSNWEEGRIPHARSEVVIDSTFSPPFYPQLSSSVSVAGLSMKVGSSLDVNGKNITVLGPLDIEGASLMNSAKESTGALRRESSLASVTIQNSEIGVKTEFTVFAANAIERHIVLGGCNILDTMHVKVYGLNGYENYAALWIGYLSPSHPKSNHYAASLLLESINTVNSERGGMVYLEHHTRGEILFGQPTTVVMGSTNGDRKNYFGPSIPQGDKGIQDPILLETKDFTLVEKEEEPLDKSQLLRSIWTRGAMQNDAKEYPNLIIIE